MATSTALIAIVGGNGKSSTAAMIDSIAQAAGFRSALALAPIAAGQSLTLSNVDALRADQPDLLIVELESGRADDPLAALQPDVTVVTSIAVDPAVSPAQTRDARADEWLPLLERSRAVVIADPLPPVSMLAALAARHIDTRLAARDFTFGGDRQQWSWAGASKRFNALAFPALRGANQLLNAAGALAALEVLRDHLPITAQAVRNGLAMVELPGRFQIVPGEPVIVLDLASNEHAAATLAQNLDQMGFYPRTHAVFGTHERANAAAIRARVAPLIDVWHPVESHDQAPAALAQALSQADPADRIVVFGSTTLVACVIASGVPRTASKHAASHATPDASPR